ncbi:MAG: amidohydrolase family protein [Myxococcales bacterium]|nr:amidohydrolase family protein [Myxococcales bacterium]
MARSISVAPVVALGLASAVATLRCAPPHTPAPSSAASPASAPNTAVALRGVRLIDGTGTPPVADATLVVEGDRIVAAGAGVAVPPGAHLIELQGKTVLPGLVSDHSHLGMVDGVSAGAGHASRENILRQLAQFEAYGVTTVMSLGLNGTMFYALQPALHRGELPGADIFGADRGIGMRAGAPPVNAAPDQLDRVATADEARAAVQETATRHPTLIKIWVDDFHGSLPVTMSEEVYRAIIDEAHRLGLRVAAHVFYLEDAKRLVADGVDVLAHGVRDRPVDDEFVSAMRAHHTWYVPTLGLDETFYVYAEAPAWTKDPFFRRSLQPALVAQIDSPSWRSGILADAKKLRSDHDAFANNLRNVKTLHDAGVAIGFGTDSGATPLRIPGFAEHHELSLLVQAGIAPIQAIRLATSRAAELLGLTDRGELTAGKLADFCVVDGDPSRDIENASRIVEVWRQGRRVAGPIDSFQASP